MNKKTRENEQDSLKIVVFILLSYMVPVAGLGFSLYILSNSEMKNYSSWVKPVAMLSLGIQLVTVVSAIIGWSMWV